MKPNLVTIGGWALIIGIILAVLAGFTDVIPALPVVLFLLGLVVGFLNITKKETTPFLIGVIALLIIGVAGLQLGKLTPLVVSILNNFIVFVGAVGLVVALKQIITVVKPGE